MFILFNRLTFCNTYYMLLLWLYNFFCLIIFQTFLALSFPPSFSISALDLISLYPSLPVNLYPPVWAQSHNQSNWNPRRKYRSSCLSAHSWDPSRLLSNFLGPLLFFMVISILKSLPNSSKLLLENFERLQKSQVFHLY